MTESNLPIIQDGDGFVSFDKDQLPEEFFTTPLHQTIKRGPIRELAESRSKNHASEDDEAVQAVEIELLLILLSNQQHFLDLFEEVLDRLTALDERTSAAKVVLDKLQTEMEQDMSAVDDLNAAVDGLTTDVAGLTTVVTTTTSLLAELKTDLDAALASEPGDTTALSAAVTKLNAAQAALASATSALSDADTANTPAAASGAPTDPGTVVSDPTPVGTDTGVTSA